MRPEPGKVYVSQTDPAISLYIEDVFDVDIEDGPTFHVEAIETAGRMHDAGMGIEFTGEEWIEFAQEHQLTLAA